MAVTLNRANQAIDDFIAQFLTKPYSKFFSSCTTSTVGIADPSLPVAEHADHCTQEAFVCRTFFPPAISGVRIVYFLNPPRAVP